MLAARLAGQERNRALMAGLALAMLAGASFFWLDPGGVWNRWQQLAPARELAADDRARMSADALRMARQHATWGVGLGAFATAYPAYQTVVTDEIIDYAHNDYAQFLAEGGTLAGALLLVSLPTFFWLGFRRLRRRLQNPGGWLQLGAAVGVCGLLLHSLVDFNLHIPANAAWFTFCAAWAVAMPEAKGQG
jgi:O-antigen ligase